MWGESSSPGDILSTKLPHLIAIPHDKPQSISFFPHLLSLRCHLLAPSNAQTPCDITIGGIKAATTGPNGAAEGSYVAKQVPATASEWVAVRLEGDEWMGLERMVFGTRAAGMEFGIGIDSFEYKRRGL